MTRHHVRHQYVSAKGHGHNHEGVSSACIRSRRWAIHRCSLPSIARNGRRARRSEARRLSCVPPHANGQLAGRRLANSSPKAPALPASCGHRLSRLLQSAWRRMGFSQRLMRCAKCCCPGPHHGPAFARHRRGAAALPYPGIGCQAAHWRAADQAWGCCSDRQRGSRHAAACSRSKMR